MGRKLKTLILIFLLFVIFYPFIKTSWKSRKEEKVELIKGEINQGDIIGNVLKENGVSPEEIIKILNSLNKIFDFRRCLIGDSWEIYFDKDGNFLKFKYFNKPVDYYIVEKDIKTGQYHSYKETIKTTLKIAGLKGEIDNSLYESMIECNVNPEIVIQFAEIFESKIDFLTDCQKGDKFSILYQVYIDEDGNILKTGKVIVGKYENKNTQYYAFYFEKEKGYFDINGKSLKSSFLKSPLKYRRISSFFSHRRYHPIFKTYRAHLGIDYSAPIGTPVSSIGDGTVIFAGWVSNGYGKCVKIKHTNGYVSYYGHLNNIAKPIASGVKVKKGDVIGYVGMTGIATGPHLDFRLKRGDKFINFLNLKFFPEKQISAKNRKEFEIQKNKYIDILKNLRKNQIQFFSL